MLNQISGADFEALKNQSFSLKHAELGDMPAVLSEVNLYRQQSDSPRQPFSLVFTCRVDQPVQQGVYQVEHEQLGELALFLVPIGKDESGLHFEAVFN